MLPTVAGVLLASSARLIAAENGVTHVTPNYFTEYSSEKIKIDYGTYSLSTRSHDNGMLMIHSEISPPCNDCFVTSMQAALEYPNGTTADASRGIWMHHVVFENLNNTDGVCGEERMGERFFASGNERTVFELTKKGERKVGYFIGGDERMRFHGELMNMRHVEQEVVVSVTWEFVPQTKDFKRATPLWLDIGGCGFSDRPAANLSLFSYQSPAFTVGFGGEIVFLGGHLHDGGTVLEIRKNGERVCEVKVMYEEGHVKAISGCEDAESVEKKDEWVIEARYDTFQHRPMVNEDGSLEGIMGIALVYIAKEGQQNGEGKAWRGWFVSAAIFGGILMVCGACYVLFKRKRNMQSQGRPRWAALPTYEVLDEDDEQGVARQDDVNVWADASMERR